MLICQIIINGMPFDTKRRNFTIHLNFYFIGREGFIMDNKLMKTMVKFSYFCSPFNSINKRFI